MRRMIKKRPQNVSRAAKRRGNERKKVRGKRIYLDYASATPVHPLVLKAMEPYLRKHFGNAGAIHAEGVFARRAVEAARSRIARIIEARAQEIVFTGSGTEANNLGIFGVVDACLLGGAPLSRLHAVTSAIEHESVLNCFKELERRGMRVSYVSPDESGITSAVAMHKEITDDTVLVSLMLSNSEIGTIQPVPELGKLLRAYRAHARRQLPYLHTDASQAALLCNTSVERLGVDLMTLDAQKVYGPKGVGALYVRRNAHIAPILFGGHQENGLRPGTENVPLIVGMAEAFSLAAQRRVEERARLAQLQELFFGLLKRKIPEALINGSTKHRMENNVNISLPRRDGELMALALDAAGVSVTTKAACAESSEKASSVVYALYGDRGRAETTLRFSFGAKTSRGDIIRAVNALARVLKKFDR